MIIKLKGADFRTNNINALLNSWFISLSLGSGATSSNPATSIAKGAEYSSTITIADGYELGSAGVTVTMGGTAITPTISGNTITISIAAVTGNVVIKVPTVNTGTGEEEDPVIPTNYTFTINPTPSTATVALTASGYTQSGNSITVPSGTSVNWSVSASGYTTQSGTQVVTSTSSKSVTLSASGESGNLLAQNDTALSSPKRLASNAYVANMLQSFNAGTTIDYIEIPIVAAGSLSTTAQTIPSLEVWVFNMETNTPVEKIIDGQSYTSEASTLYSGCYSIKVDINKQFDYPFYFGYANTPSGSYALSYYTEAGNYLSGTAFTIGTAIDSTSGSVAIHAAIYGEGSTYVAPDDVDDLTQVAFYNGTAAQKMAGNCYVANPNQTVPANTKISILDVMVTGSSIEGVNIYVVNGETNTIVEMLVDEQTITPTLSTRIGANVIRLNVDKTYTYPVYFMFNSERTNSSNNAMLMVSNATGSILLTDDERKPAVGDVLSGFTSSYNIGHAIYN